VLACGYGTKQEKPRAEVLIGKGNAIIDFRYEPLDSLTFYYDHHRTAFADEASRGHFEKRRKELPSRFVYEATYSSCTKLIAEVGKRDFGVDFSELEELIAWADRIDAARFSSAEEATDPGQPVLKVATVIEQFGDSAFVQKALDVLSAEGLHALCGKTFIRDAFATIEPRQKDFVERVKAVGRQVGRVAYADLTEQPATAVVKFIQYRIWPEAAYSVMVALMASGVRISVGHNPWSKTQLDTDISKICARYGGGGHPMVGGIGLPRDAVARAREIAREIVEELSGETLTE
jgi:hypothetical protein